jgi:uncharacterized protein (DUF2342 family)
MAIDRIGKGGPPAETPKTEGARGADKAERPFEVRAEKAEAARAASPALEQLHAGKVDVEGYLQMKLDEATAHLKGLPPADLEAIRHALRQRLASDPALVELAKHATGHAPQAPPDDE